MQLHHLKDALLLSFTSRLICFIKKVVPAVAEEADLKVEGLAELVASVAGVDVDLLISQLSLQLEHFV